MKSDEHTLLEAGGETSQSALDILLRRMQTVSDFPALSEAIGAINRIASYDREGVNALSNNILKDFALTNKLLRLANVAFYNQVGGGSISSCRLGSKAQHNWRLSEYARWFARWASFHSAQAARVIHGVETGQSHAIDFCLSLCLCGEIFRVIPCRKASQRNSA